MLRREVDEAVRQDQLGTVARKYGILIGVVLALLLAAFGGWLFWRDHQEGVLEERSERLITSLDQLDAGNDSAADERLAPLVEEGGPGSAVAARLLRAGIALEAGRTQEAAEMYDAVAADGDAPQPFRDLATVRSVAAQFDTMEPQAVVDRLKPLATPGNPWFGSAGELVGMAYLAQDKRELAGPLFAAIAKDETVPQTIRSRTRQLAGVLGVDAVVDVEQTLAETQTATTPGQAPGE